MARVLIVCEGAIAVKLARHVRERGHVVRMVVSDRVEVGELAGAGIEPWRGDPERLGTLRGVLDGVAVACWLLGGEGGPDGGAVSGGPDGEKGGSNARQEALHGPRLRAFLESAIDSTARGFVYEAPGSDVPSAVRLEGVRVANEMCSGNSIPLAVIESDRADGEAWIARVGEAIEALLAPSPRDAGGALC